MIVAALGLLAGLALLVIWRQGRRIGQLRDALATRAGELERLQQAFSRFAPSDVVDRLIAGGEAGGAEVKEVTALFCDLVGYTALSEKLPPGVMLDMLNGYFDAMSQVITAHNGHVATFVGDGILAYFGALQPNPWQCNDAAAAALAMRRALADYNRELETAGQPPLAMGIGIHRGSGLAGLVGSRTRNEYAVIGRSINLAARIQDLTRDFQVDILLSETVRTHLDPQFELTAMPSRQVKGIAQPVTTYALTNGAD